MTDHIGDQGLVQTCSKRLHTIVTDHLIRPQTTQVCLENLAHIVSSSRQKSSGRHLRFSHINARSVCNKLNDLHQYINLNNIDLCAITETWIREQDDITEKELAPNGYKCISFPHRECMGGSTALIYRDYFTVSPSTLDTLDTMEISTYQMRFASTCLRLNVLYRPPKTSVIEFCTELTTLIEGHIIDRGKTIWVGDFNIHVNDVTNLDTITFRDLLDSFNLKNMVSFPTHKSWSYHQPCSSRY